jgi:hypothetical protein
MTDDFVARAQERSQAEFAAAYPYPFLVGGVPIKPLTGPTPTLRSDDPETIELLKAPELRQRLAKEPRLVLPVRKVQGSFPSMITVGRTRNNDVVLADPLVSKFHAYFRLLDGAWMLADAGSVNGTRIGEVSLPPKGQPQPVRFGDRVTFGERSLSFLDAAGAWQALRSRR